MSNPKLNGGYVLLSRKLIESEIWKKPPLYLKVWIYLLSRAQHKQFKKLNRGQLWTTIPMIQEECSWYVGCRKETPTKDQIFNILEWMRNPANHQELQLFNESNDESNTKATMITTTKATRGLLVNIENYNVYQDPKSYESNDESNVVKATKATMTTNTINKNDKNDKNDKNNNIYIVEQKQIIDYLNKKTGSNYKTSTSKTKSLITSRLNEKYTVEDFKKVIDVKSEQWLKDSKMKAYLRPETLFGSKFEGYLNEQKEEVNPYAHIETVI